MGPCKFDGGTFIWLSLARLWPGLAQSGQARLGRRRRAGGRVGRIGDDLTKIDFLLKNVVLGQFWPFLDLLDLKNGSGSKFYVIHTRREVWRSKLRPFRDKSISSAKFFTEAQFE